MNVESACRIVAEICFRRNVRMRSRSHCSLGESCNSLTGRKDKTLGVRELGGIDEGLDEILRGRLETLSEKNEAKD